MKKIILVALTAIILAACAAPKAGPAPALPPVTVVPVVATLPSRVSSTTPTSAATISNLFPTPFITAPATNDPALVPILMYHHLADLPVNASELELTWTVSPKNFAAQMEWLAQKNFHTITMAQLNAHLKQRALLPTKPIVISFDDGWEEQYVSAFPVLKKYQFIGTFFAYTQPLGYSKAFLSWDQVTEMSAAGMDFQAHTLTHAHLAVISQTEAMREIADSKKIIESKVGKPIVSFAYPFGEYNNAVVEIVKRAGFESAVTIDPGYRQRADKIYFLQRVRMSYKETLDDFAKKLPPSP